MTHNTIPPVCLVLPFYDPLSLSIFSLCFAVSKTATDTYCCDNIVPPLATEAVRALNQHLHKQSGLARWNNVCDPQPKDIKVTNSTHQQKILEITETINHSGMQNITISMLLCFTCFLINRTRFLTNLSKIKVLSYYTGCCNFHY